MSDGQDQRCLKDGCLMAFTPSPLERRRCQRHGGQLGVADVLRTALARRRHSEILLFARSGGGGSSLRMNLFLQSDQDAIMGVTATRQETRQEKDAAYSAAPQTGVPVLEGAAAYIECRVRQIVDVGGDHNIVVGEAINADVMKEADPPDMLSLTQLGWSYAG